jgi:hypothetical protein
MVIYKSIIFFELMKNISLSNSIKQKPPELIRGLLKRLIHPKGNIRSILFQHRTSYPIN